MQIYKTNVEKIKGTSYKEVHKKARRVYDEVTKNKRRKAFLRSAYFGKDKIFLDIFWSHLYQKKQPDRLRRMRLVICGLELLRHSKLKPVVMTNPNKPSEILYRFYGFTRFSHEFFVVQLKENTKMNKKWLISIFPSKRRNLC